MRNCIHILLVQLFLSAGLSAQESSLLWQKTFGGEGNDQISALTQDSDDNIYIATTIQTINNHDILLSKVDPLGNIIWNKKIGGIGDEEATDLLIDNNGNLLLLASSTSIGDFLPNANGYQDIVLAKYTTQGEQLSINNYGGSFIDTPSSMLINNSGNIVISGSSRSKDGDLTANNGQYDMWMFELDAFNQIIWQKSFGGNDDDINTKLLQLKSGDYLLVGESTSYDGDYADNLGDLDVLLIKTDIHGNQLWQNSLGGFYADAPADALELETGNVVVAASTFSSSSDVSHNNGGSDVWLFEIDANGLLLWEESYGSIGNETAAALMPSANGFILLGTTNSITLSNSANHGEQDLWLYAIDGETKTITEQTLYGSSGFDSGKAMLQQADGSILLAGSTTSNDGLVYSNSGKQDGWLLKLSEPGLGTVNETMVHPNPSTGVFYLNQLPKNSSIRVTDQTGHEVYAQQAITRFSAVIDLGSLPSGVYLFQIESTERTEVKRVIKL